MTVKFEIEHFMFKSGKHDKILHFMKKPKVEINKKKLKAGVIFYVAIACTHIEN